jgi:hypothetical protein
MAKEIDNSKEPARKKAERRWRNHALVKKYKAGKLPFVAVVNPDDVDYEKQKVHLPKGHEPKIAETVTNDGRRDGSLRRFESRFIKEIRTMLEGHNQRNLMLYAASLQHQKYLLLKEKLRRLEAAQHEEESHG